MKTSLPRFFFFFFFGLYLYLSGTVGASHDLYTLPFEAAAAAPTTTSSFRPLSLGLCCGPFIFFYYGFFRPLSVGFSLVGRVFAPNDANAPAKARSFFLFGCVHFVLVRVDPGELGTWPLLPDILSANPWNVSRFP